MQIDSEVIDINWKLENSLFERCMNLVEGTRVDFKKLFIEGFFKICSEILLKFQIDIRSIHAKMRKIKWDPSHVCNEFVIVFNQLITSAMTNEEWATKPEKKKQQNKWIPEMFVQGLK